MSVAKSELVKCKKCGSLVRAKKLHRHLSRVHSNTRSSSAFSPRDTRLHREGASAPESLISRSLSISPKDGIKLLENLEAEYAPNVDVYNNKGVAFMRLGEPEKARACFEEILKLDPENNSAAKNLELVNMTIRILSGNEKFLESDLNWMGTSANAARDAEMFGIALQIGKKMVEVDTGGLALHDLGITYQQMGSDEKAIECFDRVLQMEPDSAATLAQKALCLMSQNRFDEASSLYVRALRLKPESPSGWYNLAVISLRKGDYEESIRLLDTAIGYNDEYYMAWFAKSQALIALHRAEEAAECLDKAMVLNPEYVAEALSGRGSWEGVIRRHTSNIRAKPDGQAAT